MKRTIYRTLNKPDRRSNGTSLQAYMTCTYKHLEHTLGAPTCDQSPDHKVNREWHVELENTRGTGQVLTVYDYKNSFDPAKSPDQLVHWHLGGKQEVDVLELKRFILG